MKPVNKEKVTIRVYHILEETDLVRAELGGKHSKREGLGRKRIIVIQLRPQD